MAELDYYGHLTLSGALNALKEAPMAVGKCEIKYPTLSMNTAPRGAAAMDLEDASYASAGMRYSMCQAWEGLKALMPVHAAVSLHRGVLGRTKS